MSDRIRELMRVDAPTRIPERIVPGRADRLETAEHMARYGFAASMVAGVTLDLGAGVGYGAAILADQGQPSSLVGLDISPDALAFGKDTYGAAFIAADARALPFSAASFDTVVCIEAIEHVPSPGQVLREIARVLRPGGLLVISTPNKWMTSPLQRRPLNPYHVREWSRRQFVRLVAQGFRVEQVLGQTWSAPGAVASVLRFTVRQRVKRRLARLGLLGALRRVLGRAPNAVADGEMPTPAEVRAAWPRVRTGRELAVTTVLVARR